MLQEIVAVRLRSNLNGHIGSARCVAFSPDGKSLVSVGNDGRINFWDLWTLERGESWQGGAKMNAVAFSPDGRYLATSETSGRTRVWLLSTGECLWMKNVAHSGLDCNTCVVFSPDGTTIAAGSCGISLLAVDNGKELLTIPDISETVCSAAFLPDGETLVIALIETGEIKFLNAETGREYLGLKGHTFIYEEKEYKRKIWAAALSSDGKTIASGSEDKTIKLWNCSNGNEIATLKGHNYCIRSLSFSPDGRLLMSSSDDRTVKLWDALNGQLLISWEAVLEEDGHEPSSVAFSPDGHFLAAACSDGLVLLWELKMAA